MDDEGAVPLCATDDCDWLVIQARAPATSRAMTAATIQLRRDGLRRTGLEAGPAGGTGRAGDAERTGGASGSLAGAGPTAGNTAVTATASAGDESGGAC